MSQTFVANRGIPRAKFSRPLALMSQTNTLAPFAANARTICRPMPAAPLLLRRVAAYITPFLYQRAGWVGLGFKLPSSSAWFSHSNGEKTLATESLNRTALRFS